ncbi:NUDIX hydrolase [Desulfosporosinus nitroreducens]|uniref:NUDIX hydrolase n=1 Tax=Desulfosporosinus nitroreducens TaxID=2018668 RepID=A0ABT8QJ77_9FIRM|nr:NUDIX hydrolase [Desulfosporosinus nitroreducens]MDO0821300.1 NUDIX hydrolase [Desulfosporosinus nitroreducens]
MRKSQNSFIISVICIVLLIGMNLLSLKWNDFFVSSLLGVTILNLIISVMLANYYREALEYLKWFIKRNHYYEILYLEHKNNVNLENKDLDTKDHKKYFLKLFRNKEITCEYIESLSDKEASIFLLGLQFYYRELNFSDNLNVTCIRILAEKASRDKGYLYILLKMSLNTYFSFNDSPLLFAEKLLDKSQIITSRENSEDSDALLFERMRNTDDEEVTIFSTTSQISDLSFRLLKTDGIKELNFFLVSPLIESDSALVELNKEYDVPDFAIPTFQFVGKDTQLDMLRRVIRILNAIEKTMDFSIETKIKVNLFLFREKYPDIKIRLLKNRSYMQVFPSSLKYANNLYRYGLEVTDREMIDKFAYRINELIEDKSKIRKVQLDKTSFKSLKEVALREIYIYLLKRGYDAKKIEQSRREFTVNFNNPQMILYIEQIMKFDRRIYEYISRQKFDYIDDEIFDPNKPIITDKSNSEIVVKYKTENELFHISVGMLFVKDDKMLMIKKKKSPYLNKISIVAGHLENGETPFNAIKREVKEELNITVDKYKLIKENFYIPGDICRYDASNHLWFVFVCEDNIDENTLKPDSTEIEEILWVDLKSLSDLNTLTFATEKILRTLGLK